MLQKKTAHLQNILTWVVSELSLLRTVLSHSLDFVLHNCGRIWFISTKSIRNVQTSFISWRRVRHEGNPEVIEVIWNPMWPLVYITPGSHTHSQRPNHHPTIPLHCFRQIVWRAHLVATSHLYNHKQPQTSVLPHNIHHTAKLKVTVKVRFVLQCALKLSLKLSLI